jgi:hypothetical protein
MKSRQLTDEFSVSIAFFRRYHSCSDNRSLQEQALKSELPQTPRYIGKENSNDEIS